MPINETQAGLIESGANLLSNVAGAYATGRQSKKTREYNEKMYKKQRADALSDWNMQNEYNSPEAQMQRLKAAGLNPNLVYGHGADAGMAAPVRNTESKSWNPAVPRYDLSVAGAFMSNIYDLKMKKQQVDNLKTQNTVMLQDAALKKAQTLNTLTGNETGQFNLGLQRDLRDVSLEARKEELRKLKVGIDLSLQANDRAAIMQSYTIKEAVERVLRSRAERSLIPARRDEIYATFNNKNMDTSLKALDYQMKRLGIMPSDPLWQRAAARVANSFWDKITSGYNYWKDSTKFQIPFTKWHLGK